MNIRRGNTLLKFPINNNKDEIIFCRRGMQKFYDLTPPLLNTLSTTLFKTSQES